MSDALYGKHLYVNYGVAFSTFSDGLPDTPGQRSLDNLGNEYIWDGSNWWIIGSRPIKFTGTASNVNDNTIVYQSPDVSFYNHHEFSVVVAPGAGAIEVLVSHDGTNYESVGIQVVNRVLVVGAAVQSLADIVAVGNYYFDGVFATFRIQNKGVTTGAAASVRGSHSRI